MLPHWPLEQDVFGVQHEPEYRTWPAGQAHVPLWQVSPPVHFVPQAPQLLSSVLVSTHELPHTVFAHVAEHVPPEHA
jgi:hypothetical protein